MPANESNIINRFLDNTQTTHKAVVANSVGMAILVLKKNYFTDTDTTAEIKKKYEHCIEEMKLAAKDQPARKSAVEFLINSANQPLNEYDKVHLYLPNCNTYAKKTHTFPLKEVIPLVWIALKDHDKFAHEINYQGTKEQQLTLARNEYNMRLNNFFNLLASLPNDLCHIGIRNEIVFLLNKIYFEIEIIEDDLSTIAATLKDHINNLFWEHYQNATDQPQTKKELTSALLLWMSEQKPQSLFMMVDSENKAKTILEILFIRHGSDPIEIKLEELINNCLPTLNFNYDTNQYPVIKLIENIFNSAYEINNEAITRTIANIITWINSHVELDNAQNTEALAAYFCLYQAYKSLDQRMQALLKETGNMQDNYSTLITYCETFFATIADANLETEFPIADAAILQTAEQLKLSIIDCKSNKMADFIENFFSKWRIALGDGLSNKTTLKHLYRIFIDDEFHEKVFMKDEEIDFFWSHTDDTTQFRRMSVYQINRVFLHGIIINPKDWSNKFGKLFKNVRTFVANHLNNFDNHLAITPYPSRFLVKLGFLSRSFDLTGILDDERLNALISSTVETCIFLPHQVHSTNGWGRLVKLVSDEKLLEIYEPQAVKINQMLYSYLASHLLKPFLPIVKMIPLSFRAAFLLEDRLYLLTSRRHIDYVAAINQFIPEHERINVWKGLVSKGFRFSKTDLIDTCIESLPFGDRLTFFILFHECEKDLFDADGFRYFYTFRSYDDVWLLLSPADLLTYLKRFTPEEIVEFVNKHAKKFINKFDMKQISELADFVKPPLNIRITLIFKYLKLEKLKMLQQAGLDNSIDLARLYIDEEYWEATFNEIPMEKRLAFLTAFRFEDYKELFPVLPLNHLTRIDAPDRAKYFTMLGADYIFRQVIIKSIFWYEFRAVLQPQQQQIISDIRAEFVRTFSNIYKALRAGQTSFFKSNYFEKPRTVENILEHAKANPDSRTAKALELMKKYKDYKTSNYELLSEIYLYSFSKSGLFKRTKGQSEYQYKTQSLQASMTTCSSKWKFWYGNQNTNTRRSKILDCLDKPDIYKAGLAANR